MSYYFVFTGDSLNEKNKEIKASLNKVCANIDSEIEEIEFQDTYLLLKMLISIEVSIAEWVEGFTKECEFVDKEYLCSNVDKPKDDFIVK